MCGIIAISGSDSAAYEVFFGLMNLQHRGQDGAGILTLETKSGDFHIHKASGLVENVFSERSFKNLKGKAAVGHTRYATIGGSDPNMLQPFLDYDKGIGLAHNGNIVNFYNLQENWLSQKNARNKQCVSDSELILRLLCDNTDGKLDQNKFFDALAPIMENLVGGYAVAGITKAGAIFGFRDPHGIRPLVFGQKELNGETIYALSSESVALGFLDFTNITEVQPGEAIYISPDRKVFRKVVQKDSISPCMFEWVYFARVESEFSGQSVYRARFRLGLLLAEQLKQAGITPDIVVPVPETSRASAIALAEGLKIPFRELLIKNRYVNRTFILDDQQSRQEAIRRKLYPIAEEFKDKSILVVDDSIVRGNTAQQIMRLIRNSGAKEITLVSTCPPISSPCYYGIDFPSTQELVAFGRKEDEIAAELGADRVIYQTIEGLQEALESKNLCMGCLTGKYPTTVEDGRVFGDARAKDRTSRGETN